MKLNVGVIFGGNSVEHEVSIISAVEMMSHFNPSKYNVIPIYIDKNNSWHTGHLLKDIINYRDIDLIKRYTKEVVLIKRGKKFVLQTLDLFKKDIKVIDIVMPIGHGTFMEDGSLQGYLNMLGIAYAGSGVVASAIGQDKVFMKEILEKNNFPITNYIWFYDYDFTNKKDKVLEKIHTLKYPVFVKPSSLGSSIGITKVMNDEELIPAIKEAIKYDSKIIIEEQVKTLKEVYVSVLGDSEKQEISEIEEKNDDGLYEVLSPLKQKALDCLRERYKEIYDKFEYKSNNNKPIYSKEMVNDIKDYAKQIFRLFEASGVARIDFLIDDNNKKIYINEINTIPGCLSCYSWVENKKTKSELIDDLITITIKNKIKKDNKTFSFKGNLLEGFDVIEIKK